jgi:hypothetical protein
MFHNDTIVEAFYRVSRVVSFILLFFKKKREVQPYATVVTKVGEFDQKTAFLKKVLCEVNMFFAPDVRS